MSKITKPDKETWVHINGIENYAVSKSGLILNISRGSIMSVKRKNNRGYLIVRFTVNGRKVQKTLHRIIANTFIPNPDNKSQVNHINGIKTDNSLENLEWCSARENTNHYYSKKRTLPAGVTRAMNTIKERFIAGIHLNKKRVYLGRFNSMHEAADAYNLAKIRGTVK